MLGYNIKIMNNSRKKYYKGMEVNAFGLPVFNRPRQGSEKVHQRIRNLYSVSFASCFKKDDPKNLIVMYDIPHNLKKERDWLRRHLVKFGYNMIQKSVWVGPSPLPKDFLRYLKEIKIGNNLKTFKLAKSYINQS
jgi:CRISPR-associated endonuclease Cas2